MGTENILAMVTPAPLFCVCQAYLWVASLSLTIANAILNGTPLCLDSWAVAEATP